MVDSSVSCCQVEAIKASINWSRKVSKPAIDLWAGAYEFIQRLQTLVKQRKIVFISEAVQTMIALNHNKNIDVLKLGCTLPTLADICLQMQKPMRLMKKVMFFLQKTKGDVVFGPFMVFTGKAVVDKNLFANIPIYVQIKCWQWC